MRRIIEQLEFMAEQYEETGREDNKKINELEKRIKQALDTIEHFAGIDGEHHKAWVIDQVTRALTGDGYPEFVSAQSNDGEFDWDEGVAP